MALNIKNPKVERLAAEVARLAGESKTEAIGRALEERRARLGSQNATDDTEGRLRRFLSTEVWPTLPGKELGRRLTRAQEERLLGYGKEGV